jgi:hypothetical protein
LREWKPETAAQVRERVAEVIDLASHDVLDLLRSRATEQEVPDLLDQPTRPVRFGLQTWGLIRTSGRDGPRRHSRIRGRKPTPKQSGISHG